jgi:hypothetical protein
MEDKLTLLNDRVAASKLKIKIVNVSSPVKQYLQSSTSTK